MRAIFNSGTANNFLYRAIYFCVMLIFSILVFIMFVRTHINGFFPAMFVDMIYGKAFKPYVYRTLLPTTVRLITATIPSEIKAFINQSIIRSRLLDINKQIDSPCEVCHKNILAQTNHKSKLRTIKVPATISRWEKEYVTEYAIALTLMFLSLWGFLWALKHLVIVLYHNPGIFTDMVPMIALLGLPCFFKYYSYLYDLPVLFLFSLGLGLMVRERWRLFMVVFILGCLNKETTILLTMIFAIHFFNSNVMNRLLFKKLLLLQILIFICIKSGLYVIFRKNLGMLIEFHFFDHNLQLFKLYPINNYIFFSGIVLTGALLIFYKWQEKPVFVRHGLWIIVPLFFFTLVFGFLDEWRDYYEAYPIVILLICHTIGDFLGIKLIKRETGFNNC